MIKAVIDIGSNSIKMRIARVIGGDVQVIRDETEVVRLGRGMSSTGRLTEDSMKLSCEAVTRMVRRARHMSAEIVIVGTMALRAAENSVDMVKDSCGLDVHILTGTEEAQYSWRGASEGFSIEGSAVMFDTGGGSTEFVSAHGREIIRAVSVPVGAVNLTERFFVDGSAPVRKSIYDDAMRYVEGLFVSYGIDSFREDYAEVIAVGGGVVAMSGVKNACENFVPSKLHGTIITRRDVSRQINLYSSLTLSERENIIGLPTSRADVILASACIVCAALKTLDAHQCKVSINGLRHGILLSDI